MEAEVSVPVDSEEGQLLILVLDVSLEQRAFHCQSPDRIRRWLDSALTFVNAHLLLHSANSVAIIGAGINQCGYLYPAAESDRDQGGLASGSSPDGQFEGFYVVEKTVREKAAAMLETQVAQCSASTSGESLVAGGLLMALSYIHRRERQTSAKHKSGGERSLTRNKHTNCRILVMTASGTTASHYMNFMNVFFTAQKLCIIIDACMLEVDSGLLQQGADLTGGLYVRVNNLDSLLQFLLWTFLPDARLRGGHLCLPTTTKVDYRAACFCHHQLLDIGFVCSVCLSVFCKFMPICTTCHTIFQVALPKRVKKN